MKEEKSPRFLREKTVLEIAALSESTLKREIEAGSFPAPYKVTSGTKRWFESEVLAWVDGVINQKEKL